jgi:hypothetical protein
MNANSLIKKVSRFSHTLRDNSAGQSRCAAA